MNFKDYIILTENTLNNTELKKISNSGKNSGKSRIEIFADKIWSGDDHALVGGETTKIKKLKLGNTIFSSEVPSDKQKFINQFENEDVKLTFLEPKIYWKDLLKTPEYGGAGTSKVSKNTQELMTACIVLLNEKFDSENIDIKKSEKIIERARLNWDKIIGKHGKESLVEQFTNNWYDLATSVSSSNAILDILKKEGTSSVKVFWTGQSWDEEIKEYNPPVKGMKDYNSSDIVVKGKNNIYYGFSLKKKQSSKDADPTLINKPITGQKSLLSDIVGQSDYEKIEKAKEIFFTRMISEYYKEEFGKNYSKIRLLSEKKRKDLIRRIPDDFVNDMLAQRGESGKSNIFWKTVNSVLEKHSANFVEVFLKLVFRVDLQDLIDMNKFKFHLVTGIGKHSSKGVGVEPAEVKDLPSTIEILSDIFSKKSLKLGNTVNKKGKVLKQPWEYDDNEKAPAKLFYTIYNGTDPILNIELRYKGSKTAEPQFQAMATPIFKNMFKKK